MRKTWAVVQAVTEVLGLDEEHGNAITRFRFQNGVALSQDLRGYSCLYCQLHTWDSSYIFHTSLDNDIGAKGTSIMGLTLSTTHPMNPLISKCQFNN